MRILDTAQAIEHHLSREVEPPDPGGPGLCLVLCDSDRAVLAHCGVGGVPACPSDSDRATLASTLLRIMEEVGADHVLVAICRPGIPTLLPSDGQWFRALGEAFAVRPEVLLGVYVVTPHGLREVLLDDAL